MRTVRDAVTHPLDILNGIQHLHYLLTSQEQEVKDIFSGIRVQFMRINGKFTLPSEISVLQDMGRRNYFKALMDKLLESEVLMQVRFRALKSNFRRMFVGILHPFVTGVISTIQHSKLLSVPSNFLHKDEVDSLNRWLNDSKNKERNEQFQVIEENFLSRANTLNWYEYISSHRTMPPIFKSEWDKIEAFNNLFTKDENELKLIVFKFLILNHLRVILKEDIDKIDTNHGLTKHMPADFLEGKKGNTRLSLAKWISALEDFQSNIKQMYKEEYTDSIVTAIFNDSFKVFDTLAEFKNDRGGKDSWKAAFTEKGNLEHYHSKLLTEFDAVMETLGNLDNASKSKDKMPYESLKNLKSLKFPSDAIQSMRKTLEQESEQFFNAYDPSNFQSTFDKHTMKEALKDLMNLFNSHSTVDEVEELKSAYMLTLIRGDVLRDKFETSDSSDMVSEFERDFEISLPTTMKDRMSQLVAFIANIFMSASNRILGNNLAHENFDLDFDESQSEAEDSTPIRAQTTTTDSVHEFFNECAKPKETYQIEKVRRLLSQRMNVNSVKNDTKETALHLAVESNNTELVQLLLDEGIDIDIIDNNKKTAKVVAEELYGNQSEIYNILSIAHMEKLKRQAQNDAMLRWMDGEEINKLLLLHQQKSNFKDRYEVYAGGIPNYDFQTSFQHAHQGTKTNFFVIPVNVAGNHWTTLIYDKTNEIAFYFDSKGNHQKSAIDVETEVKRFLPNTSFVHLVPYIALQEDSNACATWMAKATDILIEIFHGENYGELTELLKGKGAQATRSEETFINLEKNITKSLGSSEAILLQHYENLTLVRKSMKKYDEIYIPDFIKEVTKH